jgi:hypothetical protein
MLWIALAEASSGRSPFWVGGLGIGLFTVLFAWVTGKALGVSSGFGTACSLVSGLPVFSQQPFSDRWRLWFLLGLPLGGLLSRWLDGSLRVQAEIGGFERLFGESTVAQVVVLGVGGFLVGYGARFAGG